jgi:hypothetical protein
MGRRIAAFVLFQSLSDADLAKINVKRPSVNQAVWRGEHSDGELPDHLKIVAANVP